MKSLKILLMVGLMVFSGAFSGCKKLDFVKDELSRTIDILEDGIQTIENESTNWRSTVEYIYDEIPETADVVIEDARKEIDFLLDDVISSLSANIQCVIDSAPDRILEGLRKTLARLKGQDVEPHILCATICDTNLNEINLNEQPHLYQSVRFSGYDFYDAQRDIDVILEKTSGAVIAIDPSRFTRQSDYIATISLYNMESTLRQYNTLKVVCDGNVMSELTIIPD